MNHMPTNQWSTNTVTGSAFVVTGLALLFGFLVTLMW